MAKILVTGGAGYIGSILCEAMLQAGHQVTVLESFMFRQVTLAQLCINPNFNIVRGDARDERVLAGLVAKHDVAIPLAAIVGAPMCNADETGAVSTNLGAVTSLVKLMGKEQKILIPTTNSGYGIGEKGKECTEESPLKPLSLYGRTKVEAEAAVLSRGNGISLRLATVFGMSPRMRVDLLVNDFVYRAVTDRAVILFEPHFKRNYIHIRDVAKAFIHALKNFDAMKDKAFNCGLSDANLSKMELCERIREQVPGFVFMEAPVGEDPDKRDYIVSNARLEATGWKPDVTLDQGIAELIKGYRMLRNSVHGNV
jgi:nucleoside-diphosphate-sugar epimerase